MAVFAAVRCFGCFGAGGSSSFVCRHFVRVKDFDRAGGRAAATTRSLQTGGANAQGLSIRCNWPKLYGHHVASHLGVPSDPLLRSSSRGGSSLFA